MNKDQRSIIRYRERWFSYFDLLGFSNLVRENQIEIVLPLYKEVLETIQQKADPKEKHGIGYSWFSDTFILFSNSDSEEEFSLIEQASRLFFQKLIIQKIPVRGALTIGKLYTQLHKNIFLGEALIDAYEYGEKQKWLGFILTPSVYRKLQGSTLELSQRPFYRKIDDPAIIDNADRQHIYAFSFNNGQVNGRNPYLSAIREMKATCDNEYKGKYINTENFILLHAWPSG